MKKIGRVRLYLSKKLPCGAKDNFEVVVSEKDEKDAKAKYKSIGYQIIHYSQNRET